MKTKVICLYGGPGTGKSTQSASIFTKLKEKNINVELVREWVKCWAWSGREVGMYDQLYITAKQAKAEYELYGKVDFIVTDSPLLLSGFYSEQYDGIHVMPAIKDLMNKANEQNVEYVHFFLERNIPYNPAGRYQTEEQSKDIDVLLKDFLNRNEIQYTIVQSAEEILSLLEVL